MVENSLSCRWNINLFVKNTIVHPFPSRNSDYIPQQRGLSSVDILPGSTPLLAGRRIWSGGVAQWQGAVLVPRVYFQSKARRMIHRSFGWKLWWALSCGWAQVSPGMGTQCFAKWVNSESHMGEHTSLPSGRWAQLRCSIGAGSEQSCDAKVSFRNCRPTCPGCRCSASIKN